MAVLDGKLYAVGGESDEDFLSSVERYYPALNAWETVAPMGTTAWFFFRVRPPPMPSDGQPRAFVLAEHPQHGLLLLRSPGKPKKGKPAHYQLPGGRVDATDALPAAAAARELLEETGLRVLPARLVRIRVDGVVQRSYFHLQLADADAASVLGGDTAPLSGVLHFRTSTTPTTLSRTSTRRPMRSRSTAAARTASPSKCSGRAGDGREGP